MITRETHGSFVYTFSPDGDALVTGCLSACDSSSALALLKTPRLVLNATLESLFNLDTQGPDGNGRAVVPGLGNPKPFECRGSRYVYWFMVEPDGRALAESLNGSMRL